MIRIRFVAQHYIAKADDRVAEGGLDNYWNSRTVNYVSYVCCVLFLRSLPLLRCVRCIGWRPRLSGAKCPVQLLLVWF